MESSTPKEDTKLMEARNKYAEFEEKVKRTVYLDNLSPQVTEPIMRTALNQFGSVTNVHFIPNYTISMNIPRCALVEMESSKQAKDVIMAMESFPFMISGMPRPVRVRLAELEMFDNRPARPGRKIQCRWLDPKDPDFAVAKKIKQLTRKHAAEASCLLKHQLEEEAKVANQQGESLKAAYGKLEMIENIITDGTVDRLGRFYGMKSLDDA